MESALVKLHVTLPSPMIAALMRARQVDVDAVLAGGAVRDFLLGRKIKDLDIFVGPRPGEGGVPSDGFVRPDYLTDLDLAYKVKGRQTVHPKSATYLGMVDVEACYEHVVPGIGMINTIVLKERQSFAEKIGRFDFGICQVGFDGVSVCATPAFEKDVVNRTFTLVRCESERDYKRSMKRYERLAQKYPGWQLVLPVKEATSIALFGRAFSRAQGEQTCVACGKPATEFRDALSRKEYGISGFCQSCQDDVFGV